FDLVAVALIPAQQAAGASGMHDIGGPSRMIGFTVIGALSGFFIGLVNELLKDAWVKVLAGRNEGKEYLLAKPMNILGRDERCDVPLFGDLAIAAQHAAIRADGSRHILIDAGAPAGTVVNGQRMPPAGELLLRDGDMIQIGQQRILFREKATQSKVARPAADAPKSRPGPAASVPMPSNLCPYCGAPKDPSGGCLCTVGAVPGAPVGAAAPGYGPPPSPAMGGLNPVPSGASVGSLGSPLSAGTAPVSAPIPGTLRLVGLDGPYAGQVFPLLGPNMTIGRENGRDIALTADNAVSRMHARLMQEGGQLVLVDEGSSNGTFVNGMRIPPQTRQTLAPGDIVQFGASRFRLE
ncbi:MAG TPA: FHA domain-containing protein, partial [Chthonomonadaceae bacterium]|nr:FHA domain-containing protein [Chthonomonadaceae bacterium]